MSENTPNPRKPRSWRRLLLGLLIAGTLFIGSIVALALYWRGQADRELETAIAETDRCDPGWRYEELQAKREVIPPESNGALLVIEAARALPSRWPKWEGIRFTDEKDYGAKFSSDELGFARSKITSAIFDLPANIQFNDQQFAAITTELELAARSRQILDGLRQRPNGRLPPPPSTNKSRCPELEPVQKSWEILQLSTFICCQRQEVDEAAASCLLLLRANRALEDEFSAFAQLVRLAGRSITCDTVERMIGQSAPPVDQLEILQNTLIEDERFPLMSVVLRAWRIESFDELAVYARGNIPSEIVDQWFPKATFLEKWHYSQPQFWKRAQAEVLRAANAKLGQLKRPLHEQSWKAPPKPPLSYSALETVAESQRRNCAALRATIAAVAAERFRQKNNRWPNTLDELAPDYLSRVPLDPYDGKPLRMRLRPDGLVIYSVGEDAVDDLGSFARDFPANSSPTSVDLGVQLWNVANRRLPPRPTVTLRELYPIPPFEPPP